MSDEIEPTPEQIEAYQKRLAKAEEARIADAAKQISELATSLGVRIIAQPQLVQLADGAFGIVAGWGVQRLPK